MGRVVDFSAVNTKVKSMESQFLTKVQYQQLIDCAGYKEALKYLKDNTCYGETLKAYNLEELHRGELEVILKKKYIESFVKIMHYLNQNYKGLLKIIFMRYEVEDIKTILRGKYVDKDNDQLAKFLIFQCSLSTIDYEDLLLSKDVIEVIEKLKGTPYHKHLNNIVKDIEREGLFRIEMSLDFVYFTMLRKYMKKLPKEDREVIERLNGVFADLLNIQWIFRGIKYYKLNPEILINYTIYDGWKLKKEDIKVLCYSYNLSEFYSKVSNSPYGHIFNMSNFEEYLLEKEILAYLKTLYVRYKSEYKMNISVVLSYLELSLLECRDIISIVENKRYSQQSEEIMKFITVTI